MKTPDSSWARRQRDFSAGLLLCGSMLLGCGRVAGDPGGGSETHWLRECVSSDECGALSCLCGLCSTTCGAPSDCEGNGTAAVCEAREAIPGCQVETGFIASCVPPLESCGDLPCERECNGGACAHVDDGPSTPSVSFNTDPFVVPPLGGDVPRTTLPAESTCPCSRHADAPDHFRCPRATGETTSLELGPDGGTLSLVGTTSLPLEVEIPRGALTEQTTLTVIETNASPPPGLVDFSPVYRFDPPLTLGAAANLRVAAENAQNVYANLSIFVSPEEGADFEPVADSYTNAGFMQGSARNVWLLVVGWARDPADMSCSAASGGVVPPAEEGPDAGTEGAGGATMDPETGGPELESQGPVPLPAGEVPPCSAELEGFTLASLYRFEDEGGAALSDDTGVGSGSTFDVSPSEGRCGRALAFETDTAHLELSNLGPIFQEGIGVGLWVRPASITEGEAHLVGDGGGGVQSFQLILEDGVPVFRLSNEGAVWSEMLRDKDALELDVWHYVQVTYDLSFGSMYVDGIEVATTERIHPVVGSYNRIFVGAVTDTDTCCPLEHPFRGELDEIAIYTAP